ncbi:MAG TPA: xanthine dehydrogenase family protein molybdopterin-binding subunit, partial [Candidatus Sulfotelmatobacter sp.]|nr:xanthine dehydrogenase family protein molybdopterin-binding subunit [Candidatus Sulfotelmatobacter sp.]
AFRRSDHAHARIRQIDTAAARALPGIAGVFTGEDLAAMVRPMVATSRMKNYYATPINVLARGKVRYVGEPVVAVLGESRYLAEDALDLLDIAFEPLGEVADPEQALGAGAPLLHEEAGGNVLVSREFRRGDAEAVMAAAPVRVGGRFRFRRKTPMALEARAYIAEYDRGRDFLTLTSSTQVPGIVRDALVELLDLPGHGLRVVAQDVGGGFGGKTSLYPEEVLVCALARRLRRTVRWTSDRLEDFVSTSQAFDEIIDAELALDNRGQILALAADVIGDVGAYSIYPWTAGIEPVQVASFLPGPYRIDTYRGHVRAVATSKPPMGPYRGVGRPVSTFVMERLIDMAARRLAVDPADLRRRNLVQDGDFPYKVVTGLVWDQSAFRASLDGACAAIGYEQLRAEQQKARAAGRWFGIGIATYAELTGIGSRISAAPGMPINTGTETASIRMDSTGTITAAFGVASTGQGLETTLSQVVAETLGARIEDIRILQGDSAVVAHGTGSYASRSTVLAGGAATMAARKLREKLLRAASFILEASVEDLRAEAGSIVVAGTDRSLSFRDLAKAVYAEMGRLPREVREPLEATEVYDPYFGTTTSATHVCTVDIDPRTYRIRVNRYAVCEDCGRVINPLIVDGQVQGGVAQGIGAALSEEMVFDESGQLLTASLADYVVPAASDVPPIKIVHLETESLATVGGFRGMGEGGTIGAPAAVANAVADALAPLGIEVTELPITSERLFRLIEQQSAANQRGS